MDSAINGFLCSIGNIIVLTNYPFKDENDVLKIIAYGIMS